MSENKTSNENIKYCTTWASSQYLDENNPPNLPLANNSLRQIIKTSIKGKQIRLKLSNLCGETPMEIKEVSMAFSAQPGSGAIISNTNKNFLFNHKKEVIIPPFSEIYSDILDFEIPARSEISISIYFGSVPSKITGHSGSRTNSFFQEGNAVNEIQFSQNKAAHWFVISALEVVAINNQKAIVCLGDSITDGRGTIDDMQNRWTDILANRLQKEENSDYLKNLAVINQGIGGTCVSSCGVQRFNRDVLQQQGIKFLIIFYGINDILYANLTAQALVEVYKQLIKKAHENNIRVYGGTILPAGLNSEMTEEKEKIRQTVNQWILTTSPENGGFDGTIDFASIMGHKDNPLWLNKNWNFENDGLHPNHLGYEAMGNFIDLSLFSGF